MREAVLELEDELVEHTQNALAFGLGEVETIHRCAFTLNGCGRYAKGTQNLAHCFDHARAEHARIASFDHYWQ